MSNALLLAEPEPATRGFLERHLRQDGFDVVEALDGEAVELLELTRPDVVLAADSLAADLCRARGRHSDHRPRPRRLGSGRPSPRLRRRLRRLHRATVPLRGAAGSDPGGAPAGRAAAERPDRRRRPADRPSRSAGHGSWRAGRLAAKEYELLVKLAGEPQRVFTKEQLLREVWGFRSLGRTTDPGFARLAAPAKARRRGRRLRPQRLGRRLFAGRRCSAPAQQARPLARDHAAPDHDPRLTKVGRPVGLELECDLWLGARDPEPPRHH